MKRRKKLYIAIAILAILTLIAITIPVFGPMRNGTPPDNEIIEKRTRASKTFLLETLPDGRQKFALEASIGSVHYKDDPDDPSEQWKEIDSNIQVSPKANWDWEVVKGTWHLLIREDSSIVIGDEGQWLGFRVDGIAYLDIVTKDYVILQNRQAVIPTISGNKIRWEGIFNGVNLEYVYENDRFKENIEVTQIARDWCQAHPPSDYGLSNADSFLVFYSNVDWTNAYPAQDEDGNPINWDAAQEFEDKSIFFRHPVEDDLVSVLPPSWTGHADLEEEDWVPIRKRFIEKDGNYWLFFGSKIISLDQMPFGTIVFDPSVQIAASLDDDQSGATGHWPTDNQSSIYYKAGDITYRRGWLRFPINIEAGSTIDGCILRFIAYSNQSGGVSGAIQHTDEDDAADFTNNPHTRALAGPSISWPGIPAWTANSPYDSPEMKTVLQDFIDRGGYASGQYMGLRLNSTSGAANQYRAWYQWDGDSGKGVTLIYTYTPPAAEEAGQVIIISTN